MSISEILLNPYKIARVFGSLMLFLIFASISGQITKYLLGYDYMKGFVPIFYLNGERNIPTFFSALLMLTIALLLALITVLNQKNKLPHTLEWAALTSGFLFMAFDELFSVHELLTLPFRVLLGATNLGILYFAWVVPFMVIVFFLGIFFLRFLFYINLKIRICFLIAACIFLGGAIGFELISGKYAEIKGTENLTYSMIVTIEESLEMLGLIVFIWALLNYISHTYKEIIFRFEGNLGEINNNELKPNNARNNSH